MRLSRRGRMGLLMVLAAAIAAATGCSRFSSEKRNTAVARLHQMDALLPKLVSAYSAGDQATAQRLAGQISELHDGTTETVIREFDAKLRDQTEEVFEQQLPDKVNHHAPTAEVQALAQHGHALIGQALAKIGR